jgi:hypothetical protein
MLYARDKDVIEKIRLNSMGKYPRLTAEDAQYIIALIYQLSDTEKKEVYYKTR